jgi:hypothetical protein
VKICRLRHILSISASSSNHTQQLSAARGVPIGSCVGCGAHPDPTTGFLLEAMHGRKKQDKPPTEEELAALRAKRDNYAKVRCVRNTQIVC